MVFVMFYVVGGTENDMVMDVTFINVGSNNVRIFSLQNPVSKFLSNLVRFLKADLSGSESLYQMIGFVRAVFPAVV